MFYDDAREMVSLMPRDQGAIYWPSDGDNICLLADPSALPIADNLLNRVIAVHALEHSQHAASLLREIWRVLVPGGRALLIVPNRHGLWSQAAETPFGCGQPFTHHAAAAPRFAGGVYLCGGGFRSLCHAGCVAVDRAGGFASGGTDRPDVSAGGRAA